MGHTIVSVAISADASVVATGLDDGSSVVWAVDRREIVGSIWGSGEVSAIALSSDVRYLAVGHATGHVRLFLLCAHALPLSSFALQSAPTALSFSADGRWLCGAARDGRVVVLDLPSLGCVLEIQAHSRAAHARISHDNETIITASEDGTVRMWRMIAGWSPPDQIIDEIATRVATHDSIGRSELDVALDAWRVLSRVRSLAGLSARERRRAEELAATIAAKLRATVRPEPAASTAARIRNPYSRVLAVDPTLAALWS
jgi:hypothetical protein